MANGAGDAHDEQAEKTTGFVYLAAALAAITGLLFGLDTGGISGAILFITQTFSLSTLMTEVVTATVLVGAVIGAAVSGRLADTLGRRKLIIIMGVVFVIGSGAEAAAQTLYWLLAARLVVGFGIGAASFIGPLYIAEIAPKNIRGRLVLFNQIAVTSGILLAYVIDFGFSGVSGNWHWMFLVGVIPGAALTVGMYFLPESPRWLINHGHKKEAKSVLARVYSTSADAWVVQDELQGITQTVTEQGSTGYRELWKPALRLALMVGVGLAILQQITGINTIIYYTPIILHDIGYVGSSHSAQILVGVEVTAVNLAATIVAAWLIDKTGRRTLLQTGVVIMGVSLGVLGATLLMPTVKDHASWILIASIMAYVAGFAIGLGPVFWLLISEIYPLRVRAKAMSIATIFNWGFNLLVALTFLSMLQALGQPLTFFLFGGVSIATFFFSYFLVPETRGRSLEEIEAQWQARVAGGQSPPATDASLQRIGEPGEHSTSGAHRGA